MIDLYLDWKPRRSLMFCAWAAEVNYLKEFNQKRFYSF